MGSTAREQETDGAEKLKVSRWFAKRAIGMKPYSFLHGYSLDKRPLRIDAKTTRHL
jgi:hypothetical protein